MRPFLSLWAVGVSCALALCGNGTDSSSGPAKPDPDEQFLAKHAKLATDDAALLELLRSRSSADGDLKKIDQLIRQLGDKIFAKREEATRKLVALEWAAMPALRRHVDDPDTEIAQRARICINRIEQRTAVYWIPPAVRLVVKRKPPGALEALLGFLPYTADADVEEEIYYGLDDLAMTNGQLHPALVKTLNDQLPARRGVAACIVGRRGNAQLQAAVRKVMEKDTDPWVRLRAAQGILAAKDKTAVPVLIELLKEPSVPLTWQAEELLHWAAGETAPPQKIGGATKAERQQAQTAWGKWWKAHTAALDLGKREETPQRPGMVVVREVGKTNQKPEAKDRLCVAGCDGQLRYSLGPTDDTAALLWLPEGAWLAVLYDRFRYTLEKRDLHGKPVWRVGLGLPESNWQWTELRTWRGLPNGHILFAFDNRVAEVDETGKTLREIAYLNKDRVAVHRQDDFVSLSDWKSLSAKGASIGGGGILDVCKKPIRYALPGIGMRLDGELKIVVTLEYSWDYHPSHVVQLDRDQRLVWEVISDEARPLKAVWSICPLVRFGFKRPVTEAMNLDTAKNRLPQLQDPRPRLRHWAAAMLADLKEVDEETLARAVKLLESDDRLLRKYGARILTNAGPRARNAIPKLVELLGDDREVTFGHSVRAEAVAALGQVGADAVPALLAAFADKTSANSDVTRWKALMALIRFYLGKDARVDAAVRSAFQDEPGTREGAAAWLILRPDEAVRFLKELAAALNDPEEHIAAAALRTLSSLGHKAQDAVPAILKSVKRPGLCDNAIRTFGAVGRGDPQTVPTLLSFLAQKDNLQLVGAAAYALGSYGEEAKRVVPALIAALKEHSQPEQADLRATLARALGQIGPAAKESLPILSMLAQAKFSESTVYLTALHNIDQETWRKTQERINNPPGVRPPEIPPQIK